ncbi:hypothetical protein ALC56_10442 [Trachymyrmex septentrionalis]|uniref:Uncharacterized protein n=1 Tax=Trachymyrmex septentrionalis TaxID=34720 RepID=A0A195F518_9HYME|nr:hypothetical protein ALC56_10442 [Trachymyrmex septentrionalis]
MERRRERQLRKAGEQEASDSGSKKQYAVSGNELIAVNKIGENDSTDKEETARGKNEAKNSSRQVVPAKQNLHASRSRTTPTPTPTPTPTSTRMSTARRDGMDGIAQRDRAKVCFSLRRDGQDCRRLIRTRGREEPGREIEDGDERGAEKPWTGARKRQARHRNPGLPLRWTNFSLRANFAFDKTAHFTFRTSASSGVEIAFRDNEQRKRREKSKKQRGRKRELKRTKMKEGLEGGIWKTAALFPKADEKGRVGPEEGRGENGAFSVADKSVTSENAKHSPWVATKSSMVKSVEAIVVGEGDVCGVVQQQSQHVIPFLRDRIVKRITVDNEWNRTIHLDSLQNWINASASFGSSGYDSNDTYELQPVVGLVEDDELTNESFKTSARRKANLDFKCRCHSKSEEQSFNVTDEYNLAKQLHCYRELIVFQVPSLLVTNVPELNRVAT